MSEPTVEETINANLEPGHPNDLVDRVGEIHDPEPGPQRKKATSSKTQKRSKKTAKE